MTAFAPTTTETDVPLILTEAPLPDALVEVAKEKFCIDTDDKADWYLRQLAACDAEINLLEQQFEAAIQRVKTDREGLQYLFQGQLEAYIQKRIDEDKRGRKSVILPHGTCAWRNVPASVKVADPAAALSYAKEAGMGCVETIEKLDLKAYREQAQALLEKDAELLPGVEVTPAHENFSVKFGK